MIRLLVPLQDSTLGGSPWEEGRIVHVDELRCSGLVLPVPVPTGQPTKCPVHVPPGQPLVSVLDEHMWLMSQMYSWEEEGRPDHRVRIQTGLSGSGWGPDECSVM